MAKNNINTFKLGLFVVGAGVLLIGALYFIGSVRNIFGKSFKLNAEFYNVQGLLEGNSVRLSGINIGSVESIKITSDSTVMVVMSIKEKIRPFIKKNSTAALGTDGLMGNKLINIQIGDAPSPLVEEGDILVTIRPVETDQIMKTINESNENIRDITADLKSIAQKLNDDKTLWKVLLDTVLAENVRSSIVNIKMASSNTAIITGDLTSIIQGIKQGKGTIGALVADNQLSGKLKQSVVNIEVLSNEMAVITGDMRNISGRIKNGEGSIGTLLMDTTFIHNLNKSVVSINTSATQFSSVMEGLKHSFLLRRYFKKKDKVKKEDEVKE